MSAIYECPATVHSIRPTFVRFLTSCANVRDQREQDAAVCANYKRWSMRSSDDMHSGWYI